MGMKISVLYLGRMEFPKYRLVACQDEEEMVYSPAVALLIQHPTLGNILYDTGNCEDSLRCIPQKCSTTIPLQRW